MSLPHACQSFRPISTLLSSHYRDQIKFLQSLKCSLGVSPGTGTSWTLCMIGITPSGSDGDGHHFCFNAAIRQVDAGPFHVGSHEQISCDQNGHKGELASRVMGMGGADYNRLTLCILIQWWSLQSDIIPLRSWKKKLHLACLHFFLQ